MKSAHGYEECSPRGATSLDAQRESAEAYIQSQASEGWVALRDRYDDGGFTGSNSDRPGLRRLLTDIEAGKIDAVLVYKVDRLSRSLLDFAGMIRLFDDHDIAFVSVTQQFNTGSSMGRLSEFVQRGAKAIPSVTEAEFHALGDWFAVNENALRAIMHHRTTSNSARRRLRRSASSGGNWPRVRASAEDRKTYAYRRD